MRKGGRGRETERRDRARVRALKTAQNAPATVMNEWVGESTSERMCECECVWVFVYVCVCERERDRERERNVSECARKMGIKIWFVCACVSE